MSLSQEDEDFLDNMYGGPGSLLRDLIRERDKYRVEAHLLTEERDVADAKVEKLREDYRKFAEYVSDYSNDPGVVVVAREIAVILKETEA